MASLGAILWWWILSLVLSLVALPISLRVFKFLPDRGLGLNRILALLLSSYLAWIIAFASNSVFSSFLALILLAGLSIYIWRQEKAELLEFLKSKLDLIFVYEALFFFLFVAWALLRMHKPDIVDQEKFMDFAFFNALGRATHFPPYDPWLSAPSNWLNYYYFGYFSMAQFARMTFLDPAVCYNLVIAFLFALCGEAIVSIGYNLTQSLWPGFLGLGLLQVFGNLQGAMQDLGGAGGFDWWAPTRMIKDVNKGGVYLNHWWWSASPDVLAANQLTPDAARDGLISEFPNFSFIHGDMHPHLTAIPYVLLTLALGLNLVKNDDRDPLNIFEASTARRERWITLLGLALCLGVLYMTNTWDVPAYGLTLSVLLLAQQHQMKRLDQGTWLKSWFLPSLSLLVGLGLFAFLFLIFFQSPAKLFDASQEGWRKFGMGMAGAHTGMHDTLIFWGSFLIVIVPFIVSRVWLWAKAASGESIAWSPTKGTKAAGASSMPTKCSACGSKLRPGKAFCPQCGHKNVASSSAAESRVEESEPQPPQAPDFVAHFLQLFSHPMQALQDRQVAVVSAVLGLLWLILFFHFPSSALFLAIAFFAGIQLAARQERPEATFALSLIAVAAFLILGTEWFYLRDAFEGDPNITRMNTIFKFYYQAWILFSVAAPFAIYWTYKTLTRRLGAAGSAVYLAPLALVFFLAFLYPIGAIGSVTSTFESENLDPTLDGSAWLQRDSPADYNLIVWMRKNISGKATIAEAVGGAYTHFARISAYTGLAAVCGWDNHESQWRRTWHTEVVGDVDQLYSTSDPNAAQALIQKYGIQYVVVSSLERGKYSPDQLAKFATFMDVAYSDPSGAVLYKTRS